MKKVSGLTMLSIVVVSALAQGQQVDEEALQKRITDIFKGCFVEYKIPENARELALESGASPEQIRETLEGMIRKNLPIVAEIRKREERLFRRDVPILARGLPDEYLVAVNKVTSAIRLLRCFHDSNTLDLMREYALFEDATVGGCAIDTYIAIAGGDATPFLREIIAKEDARIYVPWVLGKIIPSFKAENRNEDVEKFHAFLLDMLRMEQDWYRVTRLDEILCAVLDGYPQSIQRKQVMRWFLNVVNDEIICQRCREILAEIDEIPADKRTDLSKLFRPAPLPQGEAKNGESMRKVEKGVVASSPITQDQKVDEATLQKRISDICKGYYSQHRMPKNARELVLESGASLGQIRKILEDIIRKNLPILTEVRRREGLLFMSNGLCDEYTTALDKATSAIYLLRHFHEPQTLDLMKTYASFEDYFVRDCAIDTYISIAGGDATPFLQEIIAKGENRIQICRLLGGIIRGLKAENRDNGVEKFQAFLLDMLQEEQEWYGVYQLDKILYATLDDYPQSIQREQAMRRFVNTPKIGQQSQRYREIQAEINEVPPDKRKDFRAKGELLDPEEKAK